MDKVIENVGARQLSYYPSVTNISLKPITIRELADQIQNKPNRFGSLRGQCDWYQTLVDTDKQRAKQYKSQKMPAYCPAGLYHRARNVRKMAESSGTVWVDFDDCDDATLIRGKLAKIPNCILCYVSVSGTGVHAIFVTSIKTTDPESYGRLWDLVVRSYIPDTLKSYIDPASRKMGQLAIPATDLDAWVNLELEVPQIQLPKLPKQPNLGAAYRKIGLPSRLNNGDYAERQARLCSLLDRTRPPEDYPTWIKLLASLKHGEIPEGVAQCWSERGSNYHQKSFEKAWRSLSPYGGLTIATFIWWAQSQRR